MAKAKSDEASIDEVKSKPMTSTERSRKRRLNKEKRDADNLKKRVAREIKAEENPLTNEQIEARRENDRIRKAKSRLMQSRQKSQGTKVKDRNRKRKEAESHEKDKGNEISTSRVRRHRDKVKMTFLSKKTKVDRASKSLARSLNSLSPLSKANVVAKTCSTMSPVSKEMVSDKINQNSIIDFTRTISRKRDKISNCARRLAIGYIVDKSNGNYNKVRKMNRRFKYQSLKNASEKAIQETIKHYKTSKCKLKEPTETVRLVTEFYNKDNVSRQLPYKNLTRIVKDHLGNLLRVPVRVMEITLKDAYKEFQKENPDVKIGRRSFENLRPKYVRLRRYAQRLQCCCTYHTNMDYIRKAINKLFINNHKPAPFPDNDALIMSTLCAANSIKCIMRKCERCKSFPKIDDMLIQTLKCSKSCLLEKKDCVEHTILIRQFDRVTYMHKGNEKKKLKLLDKMITLVDLVALFKEKMEKFPMHRFSVQKTANTFDQLVSNLDQNSILKIHDFSENYTCLLPEEIQSLHWVQETATVYPIVVMRKVDGVVREDHLVFISNDKEHDVPFVERCNEIIHDFYSEQGLVITHDIEYNDGCSSQFKCIRAFVSLARRPRKTTRVYTETSHGKSKSDGLGGVVKSFASRAVCGERIVIRDAKELASFFTDKMLVENAVNSKRPMLNRIFFYISLTDMKAYRDEFPSEQFRYLPGTLKIHQVVTDPEHVGHILYRQISCGCMSCLNGTYQDCENNELFKDLPEMLKMKTHNFVLKGTRARKVREKDFDSDSDYEGDLDDEEIAERENEEYIVSEAAETIMKDDIAVIKTDDDHPYYLLKLTKDPYVTGDIVYDDYKHYFPPDTRVVEGHYLELHKDTNEGTMFYLDSSKTAVVIGLCVVGNCPEPLTISGKRKGKELDMFLVDNDLHQALCELVNNFE